MLRLHFYSDHVNVRLAPINEEEEEVYRLDEIKEFEEVSQLDKEWLAELLEKGRSEKESVYSYVFLFN